jgi:hypothetical protein
MSDYNGDCNGENECKKKDSNYFCTHIHKDHDPDDCMQPKIPE